MEQQQQATTSSRVFGFDLSWLEDEQFLADAARQLLHALGCSRQTVASIDAWMELERREQERERAAAGAIDGDPLTAVDAPRIADGAVDLGRRDLEGADVEFALASAREVGTQLVDVGADILGRFAALGIRPELVGLAHGSLDSYFLDVASQIESFDGGDLPTLPRDAEVPAVRPTRAEKRAIDGILSRMPDETVRRIAPIGGRLLARVGYRVGLFMLRRVQRRRGTIWSQSEANTGSLDASTSRVHDGPRADESRER